MAGILLGQWVQQQQSILTVTQQRFRAITTDILSFILLLMAVQASIVNYLFGVLVIVSEVSIALQALLLPLHVTWLAGIVLAYTPTLNGSNIVDNQQGVKPVTCWTPKVLLFPPLVAMGEILLILYSLHMTILFYYMAIWNWMRHGEWYIIDSDYNFTVDKLSWWQHAPIHWALVVVIFWAVS